MPESTGFLSLPGEIREHIYATIIGDDDRLQLTEFFKFPLHKTFFHALKAIYALGNRQLVQEATHYAVSNKIIAVLDADEHCLPLQKHLHGRTGSITRLDLASRRITDNLRYLELLLSYTEAVKGRTGAAQGLIDRLPRLRTLRLYYHKLDGTISEVERSNFTTHIIFDKHWASGMEQILRMMARWMQRNPRLEVKGSVVLMRDNVSQRHRLSFQDVLVLWTQCVMACLGHKVWGMKAGEVAVQRMDNTMLIGLQSRP